MLMVLLGGLEECLNTPLAVGRDEQTAITKLKKRNLCCSNRKKLSL